MPNTDSDTAQVDVRGPRFTAWVTTLAAAFLNSAFGSCLGCRLYPLVVRLRPTPA